jgi:hypothetical protein
MSDVPPYTLGDLLRDLEGLESARQTNRAALEHGLARPDLVSHSQLVLWSQGANLTYEAPPGHEAAINRLTVLCDRYPEPVLTVSNLCHLRAELCKDRQRSLPEAEALPVSEVASLLEGDQAELPELASARDIAKYLGRNYEATRKRLERLRESMPDCFVEVEGDARRRGGAQVLYRTDEVLPHLEG